MNHLHVILRHIGCRYDHSFGLVIAIKGVKHPGSFNHTYFCSRYLKWSFFRVPSNVKGALSK